MTIWSPEIIDEAVSQAMTRGFEKLILGSPEEARLCQYAFINRRRLHGIGQQITTKRQGNELHFYRKPEPKLEHLSAPEAADG